MTILSRQDRRAFLRGLGACVALPALRSMGGSLPAVETPPMRMAWIFVPNGTHYESWRVDQPGAEWTPSRTLEGLGDAKQDVLLLSGLAQMNARALGDGGGDHARSAATFLTGVHPRKTTGSRLGVAKSIDQEAADLLGKTTRLRSLELGIEPSRVAGSCDSGYPCAYQSNVSWRSETQPMPKETNPRLAFERMFGAFDAGGEWSNRRIAMRQSVLDMVMDDAAKLRGELGGEDRRKLDEYLQSVRDTERSVERMGEPAPVVARQSDIPDREAETITEKIRLMFDLLVLAFQSDATRVATFMMANDGSNHAYGEIGVKQGHHELSHHKNEQDKIEQIAKIDRLLVEQFAHFVRKLRETPDGDGVLLDNCLAMYGGGISDGNTHSHHDLPILLTGRGGGAVGLGRHVVNPHATPLNNLFLSLLDIAGAPIDRFGDSTGLLSGLEDRA